ncbi:hypothetical protein H4R35_001660 [Dimargaris xerosporica]|nr:hypothetical protein H4R35_001660 [Dimargaris xerosporica]
MSPFTRYMALLGLLGLSTQWTQGLVVNDAIGMRSFGPDLKFRHFDTTIQETGIATDTNDPLAIAQTFVQNKFGLEPSDYVVRDYYQTTSPPMHHIYLRQKMSGLEVANADMNINIDRDGRIISYGSTFLTRDHHLDDTLTSLQRRAPTLSPSDAVQRLAEALDQPIQDASALVETALGNLADQGPEYQVENVDVSTDGAVRVGIAFIPNEQGQVSQTYHVVLQTEKDWVHSYIDVHSGNVIELNSWIAHAQYTVLPLGASDPVTNERQAVTDKEWPTKFLESWHDLHNGTSFTDTQGNNVHAQADPTGRGVWHHLHRPDGGEELVFDYPLDLTQEPKAYTDAAITNLFYWNNIMHDLFFEYGFDEAAGNFQNVNLGPDGKGEDAVIANGQNGAGMNNADFATPPDGIHPRMRMYLWNTARPFRDGDLDSGVIIHEYGHGISNRLTGGPTNSNCLGWGEPGGMGEGWSDFFAVVLTMKPSATADQDMIMGGYVSGRGIRRYPYSTSMETNPQTYESVNKMVFYDVHSMGGVWASILYEVYWELVGTLGSTADLHSASVEHGNTLALLLVVTGLKLQPCRPSFIMARDAIIQAEELITHGQYKCNLWKAFAKRGLGFDASDKDETRKNGFELPEGC